MNHLTMQTEPEKFQAWINYHVNLADNWTKEQIIELADKYGYCKVLKACLATGSAENLSDDEMFRCCRDRVMGAAIYAIGRKIRDFGLMNHG